MYRHGDVGIFPTKKKFLDGVKRDRLVLAEGEVTGHAHRIAEGEASLYEKNGVLYLRVFSDTATVTHEEHKPIEIPMGDYEIRIQKDYEPEGWRTDANPMKTATATEIKNRFGEYLQFAIREPVLIEKTGKPVAVLLSIDDYERLSALEDAYWIMKAQKAEAEGYLGVAATRKFIASKLKK